MSIHRGAVAWMARNPVASNLLMLLVLLGGFFGLTRMKTEVFPEFELDVVTVTVQYPGASPEEVEQGVVLAVEEAVRGLDGVKRVTSSANDSVASINLELFIDTNSDRVLSDVKTAVDSIRSLPVDTEEPQVSLMASRSQVISLVLSGELPPSTFYDLGERVRSELLASPEITQVEVTGLPDLELSIEIDRATLQAYGLTIDDVATQIRFASIELPGGSLRTDGGEILVRVADRRVTASEFSDIILVTATTGGGVRLGDIAAITDGFAPTEQSAYFNGDPAIRVVAYRVGSQTPTGVATAVRQYAETLPGVLPPTVAVDVWSDESELLEGRISLLLDNAKVGLVLVVILLALFLDLRLAFWVSLGIPICFLGAFLLLPGLDVSVNMISLFAFIVTLGLVVDDAIIVGENTYAKREEGQDWLDAAINGAREMSVPVTFAVLTTVVAFAPMMMVPGFSGKLFRVIPAVVIAVLILSLLESFFILPAHLAHTKTRPPSKFFAPIRAIRSRVQNRLVWFTDLIYKPVLVQVLRRRYLALAVGVALFMVTMSSVTSGLIPFSFLPNLEGDTVEVSVNMPYGTPIESTDAIRRQVELALNGVIAEVQRDEGTVVEGVYTTVGQITAGGGPGGPMVQTGSHLMSVAVQLVGSEQRNISSEEFGDRWQEAMPPLVGVESLKLQASFGPGAGAPIDLQLSHIDTGVLEESAEQLTAKLGSYDSLVQVRSGYAAGKTQLDFHLLPNGRSLGLTGNDVARQMRSSFYGSEALREQRGRNQRRVMVRLPDEQRDSEYDLAQTRVRTPEGGFVPLYEVATVERGVSPTVIRREDGRRVVNVSAELAPGVSSSQEMLAALNRDVLPSMRDSHPGLDVVFVGEQREQNETFASLGQNYILALLIIYGLLAVPFRSYIQPLVIMTAIPFGFIGAVIGHVLMGFSLSIISMFGIVALTGVVVNDSLVLMVAANQSRANGSSAIEAILYAGTRRMRPILLTSMTTFLGLAPMIVETSIQAQFLIPMAISLGFGVLFGTVIILLLVPALYLIVDDIRKTATETEWLRVVDGIKNVLPGQRQGV